MVLEEEEYSDQCYSPTNSVTYNSDLPTGHIGDN